jgi:hypothetical protein
MLKRGNNFGNINTDIFISSIINDIANVEVNIFKVKSTYNDMAELSGPLVNCNKLWDVNILKVKARVKLIFKKIE